MLCCVYRIINTDVLLNRRGTFRKKSNRIHVLSDSVLFVSSDIRRHGFLWRFFDCQKHIRKTFLVWLPILYFSSCFDYPSNITWTRITKNDTWKIRCMCWKDARAKKMPFKVVWLGRMEEGRSSLTVMVWRQQNWIGHILQGESLLKDVVETFEN